MERKGKCIVPGFIFFSVIVSINHLEVLISSMFDICCFCVKLNVRVQSERGENHVGLISEPVNKNKMTLDKLILDDHWKITTTDIG